MSKEPIPEGMSTTDDAHDDGPLAGAWFSKACNPLKGGLLAPGDKSVSHRALLLGAMADGETRITGLLEGDDVLRTAAAMRAFGAAVERVVIAADDANTDTDIDKLGTGSPEWRITGAPWTIPQKPIYFGNSGTGCRLTMGAAAGQFATSDDPKDLNGQDEPDFTIIFDGDGSLRSRPMNRIIEPLSEMGAQFSSDHAKLPVRLTPNQPLSGIEYTLPIPSAQVKSAILLAGLGVAGDTIVKEPIPCRDHTERMLSAFGVNIEISAESGQRVITLKGKQTLRGTKITVPGDPSSAAFPIVASLITPGSDILVRNVLLNPMRAGLFDTLREMGGDITLLNERTMGGEPVADIRARYTKSLKGVAVPASRAPSMIDEYPVLAVAAAFASGDTYMPGIEELRVKETDRIDATQALLRANGVTTDAGPDWLRVTGASGAVSGGGRVQACHDHRIAMSALVLGLATKAPVEIDDVSMIATSFPTFFSVMKKLGANLYAA